MNASVLFLKTDILAAELTAAFNASTNLQFANALCNPSDRFSAHKDELAAHLSDGQHPLLDALVSRLIQSDPVAADEVLQAIILLRVKAGKDKRKSSPFPSYQHSLRIAEEVLEIANGVITDDQHLAVLAIKTILHDLVEDFDKKNGERHIRAIFGNAIADGVMAMTTPEREELAERYPEIVMQFVTPENMKLGSEAYFEILKEQNPENYLILKAELKLRFKLDRAKELGDKGQFDELFIKAIDNPDTFASDINDMADGALRIYRSNYLGALPQIVEKGIVYLSSARASRNIADRIKYHEFVMVQMSRVIEKTTDPDQAERMKAIQNLANDKFYEIVAAFEAEIGKAIDDPTPVTPPGVRRYHSYVAALKRP